MSFASSPSSHDGPGGGYVLPAGTLVAGKYVVEHLLGRGGMGYVVAAQHVQLREPVALKFLHAEMAKKPALMARFEREARAAVRIKSEHVARVIDVGNHEGAPFIVMEMLAGSDFHKLSAVRGPLPWTEAALYLTQACEVVAEAHLYGIVHRDLKPGNLFLTQRSDGSPLVKVLDFGISKVAGDVDENLTQTTDVLGSPLYMSPEQIESPRDVDARTDVWALGAILYKMIAGKAAFAADTASASLARIVTKPPPPLRAIRPDVPPELDTLILKCLEKNPAERLSSAAELGRFLAPFAGLTVPEGTAPGASLSQPAERKRRSGVMLGVALATAAGGVLAMALVISRGGVGGAVAKQAAPGAKPVEPPPVMVAAAPIQPPAPALTASAPLAPSASASVSAAPTATASALPVRAAPGKATPSRASGDAFSDRL